MTTKLVISSNDNPDWNGVYFKENVEQDLRELEVKYDDNTWIAWILDHVLDTKELTSKIDNFICECEALQRLTLKFEDGTVTIQKCNY